MVGVEADVDDLRPRLTALAPLGEEQTGLERLERDRPVGRQHAGEGDTGEGVDAAGDVDGEHERIADVGSDPRPDGIGSVAGAVGRIDHQIGGGQLGRASPTHRTPRP